MAVRKKAKLPKPPKPPTWRPSKANAFVPPNIAHHRSRISGRDNLTFAGGYSGRRFSTKYGWNAGYSTSNITQNPNMYAVPQIMSAERRMGDAYEKVIRELMDSRKQIHAGMETVHNMNYHNASGLHTMVTGVMEGTAKMEKKMDAALDEVKSLRTRLDGATPKKELGAMLATYLNNTKETDAQTIPEGFPGSAFMQGTYPIKQGMGTVEWNGPSTGNESIRGNVKVVPNRTPVAMDTGEVPIPEPGAGPWQEQAQRQFLKVKRIDPMQPRFEESKTLSSDETPRLKLKRMIPGGSLGVKPVDTKQVVMHSIGVAAEVNKLGDELMDMPLPTRAKQPDVSSEVVNAQVGAAIPDKGKTISQRISELVHSGMELPAKTKIEDVASTSAKPPVPPSRANEPVQGFVSREVLNTAAPVTQERVLELVDDIVARGEAVPIHNDGIRRGPIEEIDLGNTPTVPVPFFVPKQRSSGAMPTTRTPSIIRGRKFHNGLPPMTEFVQTGWYAGRHVMLPKGGHSRAPATTLTGVDGENDRTKHRRTKDYDYYTTNDNPSWWPFVTLNGPIMKKYRQNDESYEDLVLNPETNGVYTGNLSGGLIGDNEAAGTTFPRSYANRTGTSRASEAGSDDSERTVSDTGLYGADVAELTEEEQRLYDDESERLYLARNSVVSGLDDLD